MRIISCKSSLQKRELRNIIKSSGLLVHLTASEEVKANVIIVPSIDVTRMLYSWMKDKAIKIYMHVRNINYWM